MSSQTKTPNYRAAQIGIGVIFLVIITIAVLNKGKSDDVVALYTVVLAAVGAGQLALFWWQLHLIRDSLQDTKEAADAAKDSAKAAITAQRPWIQTRLEIVGPLEMPGTDVRIEFKVEQKNIGNSPATNIQSWAYMACAGSLKGIPIERALSKLQHFNPNSGHSLFPNDDCAEPCWGGLSEAELNVALAEAQISKRISIVVVVSTRYRYIGGIGETKAVYTIHDMSFMDTVDLRNAPIQPAGLTLKKESFLDVVN